MPGPGGHHGGGPGMGHGGFGGGPGGPGGHGGPGGPGPGGFFRPRRRPPMMGGGWGMPPRPYRGGCCGCIFPILGAVIALITAAGFLLF